MKSYILDTHILLWFLRDEKELSKKVREIILDDKSLKYVSIISLWEISIKNRIGKLPLKSGLHSIIAEVEDNGFGIIGISNRHVEIYNTLPVIHSDPFDGILIATAINEKMTLITADKNIQKYNINWVE